jgi:hypothetical protein
MFVELSLENMLHMIYTRFVFFCKICIYTVLILSSCREEKDEKIILSKKGREPIMYEK